MKTKGMRVVVLLSAVAAVAAARASTFPVNSTTDAVDATPGDGICATAAATCTLRAAVQEANAHGGPDVVTLPAGTYVLSLAGSGEGAAATGDLDVTGDLQVNGAGAGTTIVDGANGDRVFEVRREVEALPITFIAFAIRDVTIRGGLLSSAEELQDPDASAGGGMLASGAVASTVERVTFRQNSSATGGGLAHRSEGSLSIEGATFDGNVATGSGGAALYAQTGAAVTIADSTFTGNVGAASVDGGTAWFPYVGGALDVTNTTFTDNSTTGKAGAMYVFGDSALTISGCTFDGNSSNVVGALYATTQGGAVSITDTTMTNNAGNGSGGASIYGDTVTISGGDVSDNVASFGAFQGAGGLDVGAANGVTIDATTVRRNEAGDFASGGLYATTAAGALSLTSVEVTGNVGPAGGVSVNADAGDIVLTKVRVLDNEDPSRQSGAGLIAKAVGGITLVDAIVSGNAGGDFGSAGVDLTATGAVSIEGTTIAQNVAGNGGGFISAGTTYTITNSTISGNNGYLGGGGLSVTGTGTIGHVTFADNAGATGSAIQNAGALTVVSSIISDDAADHCGGDPVMSGGNNLDSNGSCAFAAPGDQNDVDPQLGPLADNGGPTPTHLPADHSPVIDRAGTDGCPATDQRGTTRPKDGDGDGSSGCDVGAVEVEVDVDLCPNDPAKRDPGACGCGVADDVAMANGTPDCLINGELEARIARAKAIIASLSGDQDPTEVELKEIGASLKPYLTQFDGQVVLSGPKKKVLRLATKASRAIAKVTKVKAGKKLEKAKRPALNALDKLDARIAPQP